MSTRFRPYQGSDPYFFVSYAHQETDLAHAYMSWIHQQGFNLWFDDGIHIGTVWRRALAEALDGSSGVVFLCTARSSESENCLRELNFALDRGKPVIVLKLDE